MRLYVYIALGVLACSRFPPPSFRPSPPTQPKVFLLKSFGALFLTQNTNTYHLIIRHCAAVDPASPRLHTTTPPGFRENGEGGGGGCASI